MRATASREGVLSAAEAAAGASGPARRGPNALSGKPNTTEPDRDTAGFCDYSRGAHKPDVSFPKILTPAPGTVQTHLFELTLPVIDAIEAAPPNAVRDTLNALASMGLLHLPYNQVTIRFPMLIENKIAMVTCTVGEPLELGRFQILTYTGVLRSYNDFPLPTFINPLVIERLREPVLTTNFDHYTEEMRIRMLEPCAVAATYLILSLATKNVVKRDRLKNAQKKSLRGLTAGPGRTTYVSRTVLELPAVLPGEGGTHASPQPHMRRGHIHTVRFGKDRSESRKQWFPPIFVNADPTFKPGPHKSVITEGMKSTSRLAKHDEEVES
jgi:hypothetical protein